jgi:PBP1b-binding outer membrane lipoprotein LpoB
MKLKHVTMALAVLAAVACGCSRSPQTPAAHEEIIPAGAIKFINTDLPTVLAIYQEMSRSSLDIEEQIKQIHPLIRFENTEAMTRSQALGLLEKALHDQAGIIVTHVDTNHISLRLQR